MKNYSEILIALVFFVLIIFKLSAQATMPQVDTLNVNGNEIRSKIQQNDQKTYNNGSPQKGNHGQEVKRVNSAHPDMSKARGARPPIVVRPSGSGIPKGIGKPFGTGKHGGK